MPPVLKFLDLPESNNEDLQLIEKSKQFALSNQIDVEVISGTGLDMLIADKAIADNSIYVCFPFEGKLFDKLKGKGYRLIGPQCVISCLLLEIPVPKQTNPVCNVAMLGAVICCSSMKKGERQSIHQLVLLMGGSVTGDFTSAVTHLIAKEVGSMKYKVACKGKVPILLPTWVHSSWKSSKYKHLVATTDNIINEHRIPIFKGCTICVTGIEATKRESIKSLVHKNGGIYSGELNMKTCTHLLVEYPHGQKYAHARQWKLHCVSPTWFYDCLKEKHWLDEKAYIIEPDGNSTVLNNTLNHSNVQNTFLGVHKNMQSTKVVELAEKSKESSKANKNEQEKNLDQDLKFKFIPTSSIDIANIKVGKSCSYFEECKIYICNRPGAIYDICKKIISNGGGIRCTMLDDSISHILLWEQIQLDLMVFLKELKVNEGILPHILSPSWLLDSFKSGRMLPEEDYSIIEIIQDNHVVEDVLDDVFILPKIPIKSKATGSSLQMKLESEIADDSTLMNQYLNTNHESTRLSQFDCLESKKINFDDVSQDDDATLDVDEATTIFLKKKFAIRRFRDEQVSGIKDLIEEYGGEIVNDIQNCDYIIVPLSYEHDVSIDEKEVTLCWLEQSIELQELKDPKSSFLFKPIYIPDNIRPLRDCVITISQYTGIERQHLLHLAELLGGVGQEYFVRNDTSNMKASTHLILTKPEGSKYEASIKWGIPCVTKDWLFKCALTMKRLKESEFFMSIDKVSECDTNVEETNVHAWDKKTNGIAKPVISHAKNNHISIDLSAGISFIDAIDKNEVKHNEKEDKTKSIERRESTADFSVDIVKKDEIKNISFSSMGLNTNDGDIDFSKFNAAIAKEKVEATDIQDEDVCKINTSLSLTAPPDMNKSRFSFDFGDALDCFESPVGSRRKSSRKSRVSLPFELQFGDALQRAVDDLGDDKGAKACLKNESKATDAILKGVIVVVSKKLSHSQNELHQLTLILGGDIRFMYDNSCTHFIHQGRLNDTSKDYVEAKKQNKYLVSPHWLRACVDANRRVDEDKYPVTYNPRMSLDVSSSRSTRSKTETRAEIQNDITHFNLNINIDSEDSKICSPKKKSEFQKKMEELMNTSKPTRHERRPRRQTNSSASKGDGIGCNRKIKSRSSSQKTNESGQLSNSNPQVFKSGVECGNEQSQGGYITYDDPTGRRERERILEHLKRASPSQDIESLHYPVENLFCSIIENENRDNLNDESDNLHENSDDNIEQITSSHRTHINLPITNESPKPETVNLLYNEELEEDQKKKENAKNYKFLFSGITAQEKIDYGATIEQLGGIVFDVQYFNMQCTHLLVSSPNRNEKFLSALASGRWVLHKSYLEASREAGDFVNEEEHEWGSQSDANDMASAARRWRISLSEKRLTDPQAGAFSGWVVLLCIEPSKQPGLKRILEAGNANVLALRPPFHNKEGATHAFIGDKRKASKAKVDYEDLHRSGIWVLKSEYISDYLTVDPKPPTFHYLLDEVKQFNDESDVDLCRKRKADDSSIVKNTKKRTKK